MKSINMPIGRSGFEDIRENNYYYIDKTGLIQELIKTHGTQVTLITRPRRFGKTLAMSMLESFFDIQRNSRKWFEGLEISQNQILCGHWMNQYPTVFVSFKSIDGLTFEAAYEQLAIVIARLFKKHLYLMDSGKITTYDRKIIDELISQNASQNTVKNSLLIMTELLAAHYGKPVILLIDEYDVPLAKASDKNYYPQMLDIMKGLLQAFKDNPSLKFAVLTGCLRIAKESIFTGVNNFVSDTISDTRLNEYFGFTEPEVLAILKDTGCMEHADRVKKWYDGYHFGERMTDIYNPFSILNAFDSMAIRDYWFSTGTPTYLVRLLQHSREQINELAGRYYVPSLFVDYKADVEQPLPMIYQSGYLTIKEYNRRMGTYLLDFPNNEVRKGFLSVLAAHYLKPGGGEVNSWIIDAVTCLEQGNTSAFCDSLTAFLASIPYDSHASLKELDMTEKHFQYTFYLILRLIGVYCRAIHCENRQSFGRVDCILEMDEYVYIFEFKMDGTAEEALQQIAEKGYARSYLTDNRKIVCIGVNFSSLTRTVEEWKEIIYR